MNVSFVFEQLKYLIISNLPKLLCLFSDSEYLSFKEIYYPHLDSLAANNESNLFRRRKLLKNRQLYRNITIQNGSISKKLAVKLNCSCGRSFSYLAGYRYHMRWECGKILKCTNCGKVYTDKSNLVKHSNSCSIRQKLINFLE